MAQNSLPLAFPEQHPEEKKDSFLNMGKGKDLNQIFRNRINQCAIQSITSDKKPKRERPPNFKINIYESKITKRINGLLLQVKIFCKNEWIFGNLN
jgi:hypothetical protein